MSKKHKKNGKTPTPASDELTMSLFAPGMSILHRAGLGGLACTLKYIERAAKKGSLAGDKLPAGSWMNGKPPWSIDSQQITLDFCKPEDAKEYLRRLFDLAFCLDGGLIFLPGQYTRIAPPLPVRVYLQQGITLSFLQHGRVRNLAKTETVLQYQPEGADGKTIDLQYKQCSGYKHQDGWQDLVDKKGCLKSKPIEVVGPLNPGAVVRHNAFAAQTKIEEAPSHIVPLYFALVGCLTLSINRGSGVLIVPDVHDLLEFIEMRPWMTPTTDRQCQIASASDAALQAQLRVRLKQIVNENELPACHAATFQPTPWASQQKSRVRTLMVPPGHELDLEQFETALTELPPRIAGRTLTETKGRGKQKQTTQRQEWFWVDSIVRPLVAENLARGQPWYRGFVDLMTKLDPVSKRPLRDKLFFEKEGLHAMIERIPWKEEGESTVVRAVHEALRRRYGQIANENKGNPVAMKNRWGGEYDRWRLAFAGAKTPDQFRRSLCDLFSRAGVNSVLQQEWEGLLPMLAEGHWQLTRDLALLGLASYTSGGATDIVDATQDSQESK